jgi:hypothetical protein
VTDTRREFDDLFFSLYLPVTAAVAILVLPPLAGWVALRVARELRAPYPAIRSGTE